MPEKEPLIWRIIAQVRCMMRDDWIWNAGQRFRTTTEAISEFSEEHVHLKERAMELPDLGWKALSGVAQEKYAAALKNLAEEERNKPESALKRRTLGSQARPSEATANKLESDVRVARINEMNALVQLFDTLKARNAIPIIDRKGNMTVYRVSSEFDRDALQGHLLQTGELPRLISEQPPSTAEETTASPE
jgi:hypothetical protein